MGIAPTEITMCFCWFLEVTIVGSKAKKMCAIKQGPGVTLDFFQFRGILIFLIYYILEIELQRNVSTVI